MTYIVLIRVHVVVESLLNGGTVAEVAAIDPLHCHTQHVSRAEHSNININSGTGTVNSVKVINLGQFYIFSPRCVGLLSLFAKK